MIPPPRPPDRKADAAASTLQDAMTPQTRTRLLKLLQAAVILACFWYLLHDMQGEDVLAAVRAYSPWRMLLFIIIFLFFILPAGVRLNYLTGGKATLPTALAAFFFGNGVNNLLPAKLGEVAKAAYLARRRGISAAESLCVVFWERLSDLNVVLVYAVGIGLYFSVSHLYLPLLGGMLVIWCGILLLFRFPGTFVRMTGCLPSEQLRGLTRSVVKRLGGTAYRPRWPVLMGLSLTLWSGYVLFTFWFLTAVCHLPIGVGGAALVCIAGGVGLILPSMPAGLGPYEAACVAALGLLGIDKAQALGAVLALHLTQAAPFVLFAGYVLLREDFHLWRPSSHKEPHGEA